MEPLVSSNTILSDAANWLVKILNSGHTLRLFQNDLVLTPATILPNFIESSFGGYGAQYLGNQIPNAIKQVDGLYIIAFASGLFACESGTQTVYGVYIDDGYNVKFSQSLAHPININPGVNFTIPISIYVESLSIIPPC